MMQDKQYSSQQYTVKLGQREEKINSKMRDK